MKPKNHKYQDPTRKDWIVGVALLVIFVIVIIAGAFLLLPEYWYWWLMILFVSTFLLVINQSRNYACRCRECGHEFEISFLVNLFAPHGVDKKGSWQLVNCPGCEKRAKATVIKVLA